MGGGYIFSKIRLLDCQAIYMTPAQKQIYVVIDEYWKMYGYGPSIDDVMYLTGEQGRGNVRRKMWKLVDLGVCKGVKGTARSIRPSYIRIRDIE